jgi:prepilin-type N-terminal cleavage/methylation domain-containing protein
MKKNKGFSLIEVLIVIVVITILAVIAIPNLTSAKKSALKASMISDLRNIVTAQVQYFSNNDGLYSADAVNLTEFFVPSDDNTVTIEEASNRGWHATITNSNLGNGEICEVIVGKATDGSDFTSQAGQTAPYTDGEVACDNF